MSDFTKLCDRAAITQRGVDAAQDYLSSPPSTGHWGVTVDWSWGNPSGRAIFKEGIRPLVEAQMGELMARVFSQLQDEARQAREALIAWTEEYQRGSSG